METIQNNFVVEIDYTLTDENGEVLDSSSDRSPLAYIHGLGHLIPGLENEIQGKVVGDSFTATIPPEQAYGVYDENLIYNVPLSDFRALTLKKLMWGTFSKFKIIQVK